MDSLGGTEESADALIVDVVKHADVSVRLFNCIVGNAPNIPFQTVGDYLAAGDKATFVMKSVPNLGRKSADELEALIRQFVKDGTPRPVTSAADAGPKQDDVRLALIELFDGLNFPDVFLEGPTSTRLAHALKNHIGTKPLSDLFRSFRQETNELLRLQNVGKTSVCELEELSRGLTGTLLNSWGFPEPLIAAAQGLIFGDKDLPLDTLRLLQVLAEGLRAHPDRYAGLQPPEENFAKAIDELMAALPEREQKVVQRRYGFNDLPSETLEEIAQDHSLTRERIRQIEAKALRRLALPSRAKRLRLPFDRMIHDSLIEAAQGQPYVRDGEQAALFRALPASVRLAIDVLYPDRPRFLHKHATRWHEGWLLDAASKAELDGILCLIRERRCTLLTPAPLARLIHDLPPEAARITIELATDLVVFDGYVLAMRASARRRRAVRLHKVLLDAGDVLDVRELVARYHGIVPDDHCSVRDAIIVMLDAPHLFLPILDGYWYGLGRTKEVPVEALRSDGARLSQESEAQSLTSEDESIRSVLREVLFNDGPLRFVDLRARATKRLGRKSASSVGPILLTSGEFIRPLPGIYAVAEQMPSLSFVAYEPPAFLLSPEQARWFAMARYAGEPYGRYPLWVPEAEYALCRWAQTHADPVIYQSLLAIASVDSWPVSGSERAHWSALKAKEGRYGLAAEPRVPVSSLVPPLDRVFAACVLAHHDGGLSWITANRILKLRLDSHVSPGLLAVLLAMECLVPVADWQKRHPAGPRLPQQIERMSCEMQESGTLNWENAFGQSLISEMHASLSSSGFGWLDRRNTNDLLAALGTGQAAVLVPDDADESLSAFEELLREANRLHEAELVQEALRSITQS